MFFNEHFVHEIVVTEKGTIILIDVADTFDAEIEGAYAIFDEEAFLQNWDGEYTLDDIRNYGEEFDAFENWEIVSSHHRKYEVAERNVRKAIKNL